GVKGGFFLIGKEAERYPELVEQIHKAGHSIGNHSYKHLFMPSLQSRELEREVQRTNEIIEDITGEQPTIFRPPYGLMCHRTAQVLTDRSMHPVYWTQAPEDWSVPGAHRVIRRVLMRLKPGSLIVLHEGPSLKSQTLSAAKEIIYRCKSEQLILEKVQLSA
ncbi:MAG: polysaccharide deacetylase family protein, partial [Cyanobacteria bacterium]|nr:polysaccharide deacetylase family protein [Cyanobacteriota bacterium]